MADDGAAGSAGALKPGEHVLDVAPRWLDEGRKLALATVIETWGSAPQPRGSQLLIDGDGNFLGSVSGGCVEGAVVGEAAQVIANRKPKQLEFGVSDEMAWEVGLACGGTIRVWVEPLGGEDGDGGLNRAELNALNAARGARQPVAAAVHLDGSGTRLLTPKEIAAEPALGAALEQAFRTDQPRIVDVEGGDKDGGDSARVFLNSFNAPLRMVVIGAVHVTQYLAPMAEIAGFDVTIIDPREAFANAERFPGARVIADWPDDVLPDMKLDARTALVLLTHDPKIDDPALHVALKTGCLYIGALGSKKTHAGRVERLKQAGFDEAAIARIHAPIGLDIGARGPAEIAVSILGEVTSVVRRAPVAA